MRSPSYGAPGRVREGDLEVAGGIVGITAPIAGGARIGYGVRDWAAVEGSVDASDNWLIGSLGGRFTHAPRRDRRLHAAFDGELGLGAGVGGHIECPNLGCPQRSFQRLALGTYGGLGAGYHIGRVALFVRSRFQGSAADGIIATFFWSTYAGVQVRLAERVDIHVSGGGFGVHNNSLGDFLLPLWDFGVAYRFDLRGRRR